MKKQIFIFDLDDTVINSSHRATLKNDCIELDLDAWRRDSTRETFSKINFCHLQLLCEKVYKINLLLSGCVQRELCNKLYMFFFFFKQKTAYEISECDWR